MTETVTRLRADATGPNRYNNTELDWSDPDELEIPDCLFAPGGTREDHVGRDAVLTNPTVYAPFGSDIKPADRLIVRDVTFDVDGQPADWQGMSGWEAGMVLSLKRVTG